VIERSISTTHRVLENCKAHNFCGIFNNLVNLLWSWIGKRGGLWLAYHRTIPEMFHEKYTFTVSESLSFKGILATLFDMSSYWPGKYLLILNVHLDHRNLTYIKRQFQEIHDYLGSLIEKISKLSSASLSFSDCGVLILGDFNTPSTTPEYQLIVEKLRARGM
jgi:hypothetical protein